MAEIFCCPLCKKEFISEGRVLKCPEGHCFDLSASGYVNLLPVQKRNSKLPGDSPEMVSARRRFLDKGYYAPLKREIAVETEKLIGENSIIFDCGCGEGYYTEALGAVAEKKGGRAFGIDISKTAIDKAAKRYKNAFFAVASAYDLPIKSNSVDLLTNIFAPLALSEFERILKKGAIFIYVVPAEKHLLKMKEILYENPYENEYSEPLYNGFEYIAHKRVTFPLKTENSDDTMSLFGMTPYFWRTPKDGIEKLKKAEVIEDMADFYIHILKKVR